MAASAPPRSNRFHELDGLRGIAALTVVVSHYTGAYNSHFVEDPAAAFNFPQGAFGVQLFFLISGFVILMSARRARVPSDFVISRLSRLYPAYWASLALAVVLMLLWPIPGFPIDLKTVLVNITMVQRWLMEPNVVDVYWTLAVEMQFYVLILILLYLTRCRLTPRVVYWVSGLWTLVCWGVALWAHPYTTGVDPQLVPTLPKIIINLTLAEYGPLFIAGMFLYLVRTGRLKAVWALPALASAVGIAFLLREPDYGLAILIVCALFTVVVLRERTGLLLWAPIQWYGRISYSLYVVHSVVGYLVIKALWPWVGRDLAMLFALAAASLVAWAVYRIAEVHGSRLLKSGLESWRAKWTRGQRPDHPRPEASA